MERLRKLHTSLTLHPKVVAVMDKPYKRDLSTPFNVFYNEMSTRGMAIAGSKRTLMKLYGVGSVLPHNINNPN